MKIPLVFPAATDVPICIVINMGSEVGKVCLLVVLSLRMYLPEAMLPSLFCTTTTPLSQIHWWCFYYLDRWERSIGEKCRQNLSNVRPNINLELIQSAQQALFLDTIVKPQDGHLITINGYAYLHDSSFHPEYMTKSIVYSQQVTAIRCTVITSAQIHKTEAPNSISCTTIPIQHR